MKAGKLRHLVTIEKPVQTQTASGDSLTTWQTLKQVYAEIEPLRGKELWTAQMIQPTLTHQVRIRFLEGLTSDMRVVHGSRILHIGSPPANTCEYGAEMTLLCMETT